MNKYLQILSLTAFALIGFAGSGNCDRREQCLQTCAEGKYDDFNQCLFKANLKHFETCIPLYVEDLKKCIFTCPMIGAKEKEKKK